jgi:hypothetical protein
VVSLSAVWQHVAPADRLRAFRKLVGLLKSGGLLVMTLRHGPDDGRGVHPVSLAEVETLARSHGLQVVRAMPSPDLQGRPDISWTAVVLRLPDDGTGALPLLRHLILQDAKQPTSSASCIPFAGRPTTRPDWLKKLEEEYAVMLGQGMHQRDAAAFAKAMDTCTAIERAISAAGA